MSTLGESLSIASVRDLRATYRFLHRAGQSRSRLGWSGDWPPLVAAYCVELTAELVHRGEAAMICGPCQATVDQYERARDRLAGTAVVSGA